MAKMGGFLAAIVLSAFFALVFFDVVLDSVPQWAVGLVAGLSAVTVFVSLLTTTVQLEAERREHQEAEQKLQEWRASGAALEAKATNLKQQAAHLANKDASLVQL